MDGDEMKDAYDDEDDEDELDEEKLGEAGMHMDDASEEEAPME